MTVRLEQVNMQRMLLADPLNNAERFGIKLDVGSLAGFLLSDHQPVTFDVRKPHGQQIADAQGQVKPDLPDVSQLLSKMTY